MFEKINHTPIRLSVLSIALVFITGCNSAESSDQAATSKVVISEVAAEKPIVQNDLSVLGQRMTVHKSPTCGCCQKWVDYLEEEGFTVDVKNSDNVNPIKQSLGMTDPKLYSCHTAVIGDYIVEGHVPASDIKRLLTEKPNIAGLTAPGMPMMSPGMNSRTPKDYAVLSITTAGSTQVYSQY